VTTIHIEPGEIYQQHWSARGGTMRGRGAEKKVSRYWERAAVAAAIKVRGEDTVKTGGWLLCYCGGAGW